MLLLGEVERRLEVRPSFVTGGGRGWPASSLLGDVRQKNGWREISKVKLQSLYCLHKHPRILHHAIDKPHILN
jgi:hypothetical protein